MSSFKPPNNFAPPAGQNVYQSWCDWKEQFKLYLLATKENGNDEVKIGMMLYAMGAEWLKVSKTFTYVAVEDHKKLDKVIEQFDRYFQPKKLIKAYVTKFHQRTQQTGESLSEFIVAVRDLAAQCEFGDNEDRMVAIQISNGVVDEKLKEKLWEDDLSLADVITRCNRFDQMQETRQLTSAKSAEVHAVRGHRRFRGGRTRGTSEQKHQNQHAKSSRGHGRMPRGVQHNTQQHKFSCNNCGTIHGPRHCPAYRKPCSMCGRIGHFGKMCRSVRYVQQNVSR